MSDTESIIAAPHAHLGGKSLSALSRPRYKSWRKKYHKIRHAFDETLEYNRQLYKDEQKLEGIAKRLREDLDGLLDLCLDINQNPNISPELRFNVRVPQLQPRTPSVVPEGLSPAHANSVYQEYIHAVRSGEYPQLDLHVVREQIDERLAGQEVRSLAELERSVPHATLAGLGELPEELAREGALGYLTGEQESNYIVRLDTRLGDHFSLSKAAEKEAGEEKPWTALSTREQDWQCELMNPQSQHNWLKRNYKLQGGPGDLIDDNESLASHERPDRAETKAALAAAVAAAAPKKRGGKNLAKQVGDRAVERAREGWSPSNYSGFEEDELLYEEVTTGSGRKKGKDPDGSYRAKGGRSGTSKGKRKRSGEDGGVGSPADGAHSKKARVESGAD